MYLPCFHGDRGSNLGVAQAAVALLLAFCSNTRADYSDYVPQLLRGLIHLFTHKDEEMLKTSWLALSAVTKVGRARRGPLPWS